MVAGLRAVDPDGLILREHDYFANLGIPSGQPPLTDSAWLYSPHGYDLTVTAALGVVARLLDPVAPSPRPGYSTPSQLMGSRYVLGLPGVVAKAGL